ncbi:hypothetical protein BX600DRAFT_545870 [Xylariales sp. PMI_506]|nr:hypothetical protein BX600DRAFT_545870 [Xylariales sp. PMI_506]
MDSHGPEVVDTDHYKEVVGVGHQVPMSASTYDGRALPFTPYGVQNSHEYHRDYMPLREEYAAQQAQTIQPPSAPVLPAKEYSSSSEGQGFQYGSTMPTGRGNYARRTICGLAVSTFALLVALIVVVLAAALGGGVGGTMAVQHAYSQGAAAACQSPSKNGTSTVAASAASTVTTTTSQSLSSSSTTSTSTSYLTVPTTNVALSLDCPNLSDTYVNITLGTESWAFYMYCGADVVNSTNIFAATVYDLADCVRACASYNLDYGSNACTAIEFNADLSSSLFLAYGNCWAKNVTGTPIPGSSNRQVLGILQAT